MILKLLTTPLFLIASGIIALIPNGLSASNSSLTGLVSLLSVAFQFFPIDVWVAVFGSITFWVTAHLLYAIINFVLRLIPFASIGQ